MPAASTWSIAVLEDAARATGHWIAEAANAAGAGVVTATDAVTRPFRSIDLDGDGIPDSPQALTAAKGIGGAIAGAAGTVSGAAASLFKTRKRGRHAADTDQHQIEATPADGTPSELRELEARRRA
jgi:hypothetical protein